MKRVGVSKSVLMVLLFGFLFSLLGCRGQPIYQAERRPIHAAESVSLKKIEQTIQAAAEILGWGVKPGKGNELLATMYLPNGRAVVSITFSKSMYNVRYSDSLDLKYDGKTIHGSYNKLVRNLDNTIRLNLTGL